MKSWVSAQVARSHRDGDVFFKVKPTNTISGRQKNVNTPAEVPGRRRRADANADARAAQASAANGHGGFDGYDRIMRRLFLSFQTPGGGGSAMTGEPHRSIDGADVFGTTSIDSSLIPTCRKPSNIQRTFHIFPMPIYGCIKNWNIPGVEHRKLFIFRYSLLHLLTAGSLLHLLSLFSQTRRHRSRGVMHLRQAGLPETAQAVRTGGANRRSSAPRSPRDQLGVHLIPKNSVSDDHPLGMPRPKKA